MSDCITVTTSIKIRLKDLLARMPSKDAHIVWKFLQGISAKGHLRLCSGVCAYEQIREMIVDSCIEECPIICESDSDSTY
jgi:hypothetical protein